jgi:SAM-dependent methyltransferase
MFEFETRERADEDAAAENYDHLYHGFPVLDYWDDDFATFVARQWGKGDRVLDLGCATASLWQHWRRLPSPSRLVGVDISDEMVSRARQKFPDGEFVVARAHDLPFEAGSFDLVVTSSVLHHIPDDHLDGALAEIDRVLDEHGRLVGRDPIPNTFGGTPGWFSGALMNFRHLAYRLTRSREFPEPALGDHHHVFEESALALALAERFTVTATERRFPFSSYVSRVRDRRVAALARRLDDLVGERAGSMIYYVAEKNYVGTAEMLRVIDLARKEVGTHTEAEFLAYLQAATVEMTRLLGDADYDGGSDSSS